MACLSKFNCFRGRKLYVMADRCPTCIFRPGNLMDVAKGRVAEMVLLSIENDTAIVCHDTIGSEENAICKGFYDCYHLDTAPLRIAKGFNKIAWQPVQREKS